MANEPQTGTPAAAPDQNRIGVDNLRVLETIEVSMAVEVGRTEITIRDLLRLNEGSVVELDRLAGDPLDILVNGTMIAKGEVVMVEGREMVRTGTTIFDNLSEWCETKGEAQRKVARKLRVAAASLLLEAEERENEACD